MTLGRVRVRFSDAGSCQGVVCQGVVQLRWVVLSRQPRSVSISPQKKQQQQKNENECRIHSSLVRVL